MNAGKRQLSFLLGTLAVAVVLVSIGTAVADSNRDDDVLGVGLLDPFSLATMQVSSSGMSTAMLSSPRPAIRIPFRPSLRSPFRPPLILR